MNNIEDLRKKLVGLYEGIENGSVSLDKASQLIQAGATITQTAKTQLHYKKWLGDKSPITFLQATDPETHEEER